MAEDGENGGKSHSNSISIPTSSSSKDEIRTIAQKIAAQTAQISRPGVWGVLTAISDKARKRSQGMHILMHGNEHVLGRTVKEKSCQFESPNVSGRHCRVYRKEVVLENTEQSTGTCYFVFLKDSSSNGTYLNWEKLKKDSPETQVQHGDIISLVSPPEHENAFAFVYREIRQELSSSNQQNSVSNTTAKRKASITDICGEDFVGDGKRIKGLGIGGPEGPVSLDDVRRLQRSNEDLRQQLEAHVLTIEKLHSESRATAVHHDNELKELRESISVSFLEEIKEIRHELATKEKELEEAVAVSMEQQSCIEDLNQRLAAAAQSRRDAEEIIQSQKAAIAEHKKQLEEERNQRRDEREKGEADLKAAVERVRAESLDELKRQSEAAARQQKEQLDVIMKLQESDKENRMFMETLRSKLEDVRESLVKSEKRGRQLEVQLHEEELASAAGRKKAAEKDHELQRTKKQLEPDFNKRASRIGLGIHEASQKIARLAKMTKKTSMFDDPAREIEELTAVIKQDITALNAAFSDLQALQNSHVGDGNFSKDSTIHFTTIVDDLNNRLKGITKELKDVLVTRSENLKAHENRKQLFSSNASRGNPFAQQRGTVVNSAAVTDTKPPPWTNGSNFSASLPTSRVPLLDHSNGSQLRRRVGGDGATSIQIEGHMQQQLIQRQDNHMQSRATALQNVESTISELGNIFTQLATMVAHQGELAIRIDDNMDDTLDNVEGAQGALLKHLSHISSNRWLIIKILFVLIIFLLIFIVFVA